MKKIIILDATNFYFPTKTIIDAQTGKKEEAEVVEDVSCVLEKIKEKNLRIVNICRENQDKLRKKLNSYGYDSSWIYNIHDEDCLKVDDFEYVMRMIMSYFHVKEDEMWFMGGKGKDLKNAEEMGIECIDEGDFLSVV